MLQAERQDEILQLVDQEEIITIDKLVTHLQVSKATIRRDIDVLAAHQKLIKTRGGVLSMKRSTDAEPSLRQRSVTNIEEKRRISRKAHELIAPGDHVIFDSGTTVLELVKLLDDQKIITAVTYDLLIAMELAKLHKTNLLMIGGELRKNYYSFYGYFAVNMLKFINVNKAFVSADAINPEQGLMSYTTDDVEIKKLILENAKEVYLLCDHQKFESKAFIKYAPLTAVDKIITGREAPEAVQRKLRSAGIDLELV